MPIPMPKKNETKKSYLSRCMTSLSEEYKNQKQRFAVCMSKWEEYKEKSSKMKDE